MAPLETFPLELIVEVLAKLPVKSLLRFRCVSKSCDMTITDPFFSKLHQTRPCLFFSKSGVPEASSHFTCLSNEALFSANCDDTDGAVSHVSAPWAIDKDRFVFEVLGSCNGLVCLYCYSTSTIWNPSTRKFRTLPPIRRINLKKVPFNCGFGYDEVNDDYKVVQEYPTKSRDNAFVFSLKSGAWRRIPHSNICRPSHPSDTYAVPLRGALHWVAISGEFIIAFNLAKEKYEVLPGPEIGDYAKKLSLLGEHLWLCSRPRYDYDSGLDVWMMKEYGVKSSWTKMFQVPNETLSRYGYSYNLLLFTKEDEIVTMVSGKGVAALRFNTGDLRFKEIMLWPDIGLDCVFLYRESLVSPLVTHQA